MFEENDVKCDMQTIKLREESWKNDGEKRKTQQKIIFLHKSQFLFVSDVFLNPYTHISHFVCLIIQY